MLYPIEMYRSSVLYIINVNMRIKNKINHRYCKCIHQHPTTYTFTPLPKKTQQQQTKQTAQYRAAEADC